MKKQLFLSLILFPVITNSQVVKESKNEEEHVFEKIEIEAGFKGGVVKWNEFVRRNFNFASIENDLPDSIRYFTDTAKIQFIVDKNGIIRDIKMLTRNIPAFQRSCIEIYKNSPHWKPANQCGRAVNAYRKETFIVQIDKLNGKRVILVRSQMH